jgi:hypothetical protein
MPLLIDITGQVFGYLTVLSRVSATGQARWLCRCKCGKETIQPGYELRSKKVISCGCIRKANLSRGITTTHGRTGTKEYRAWLNMRNRCNRKQNIDYKRYGAKGITVCQHWLNSFENFFKDMGLCPKGYSLDRINSNGIYSPKNCRWASIEIQANNRSCVKQATLNGITKPISVWCRELYLSHRTIRARIYEYGWSPEKALITPIRKIKH